MTNNFMFHVVRPPATSCDLFTYEICHNTISGKFRILKTGGISGIYELYGPLGL